MEQISTASGSGVRPEESPLKQASRDSRPTAYNLMHFFRKKGGKIVTTRTWLTCIPRAFALGLAAGLFCLAPTLASASTWIPTQVDYTAGADTGKFASLVLDANKKMHVSYYDAAGK